ncbi:TPA: phage minor tail protein L, partial [Escherichia coli]|nr:phage minor tail protein L [Escherichia coli]
ATVVRRRVYARFLDAVNFVAGNPEADPEQELRDRWVVEQMSELTAMTASFVLATVMKAGAERSWLSGDRDKT